MNWQLRMRFESDRLYEKHEVQLGWRVRLVEHRIAEFIGLEGVVESTLSTSGTVGIRRNDGEFDDFSEPSQRWIRLA